jgi:long-chain acyl-CoA synthetase
LPTHTPEEISQFIRQAIEQQQQRLPSHRQIRDYAITFDPLPRTHLGKIRRHQLAQRYQQAKQQAATPVTPQGPLPVALMSLEDQQLLEEPTAKAVWDWLTRRFPQARLTPDSHLRLDLDIDSLAWLNLTLELREFIGVLLTDEAISRIITIRDLLRETLEAERITITGESPLEALRHPEKLLTKEQQSWLQPPGFLVRAFGLFLVALNRLLMYRIFRLKVHGYEHLPQHGPFLLLPNHISLLDPPALVAALSKKHLRLTYWGGWTGIMFSNPLMRLVSRATRVVAIDPEHGPLSSIAFAIAALRGGYNLVWFPEGGISRSGRLQHFRPGIGLILSVQPLPVIPVWITGSAKALPPDTWRLQPHPITITFGEPIPFEEIQQLGWNNQPEHLAEKLYHHMRTLEEKLQDEDCLRGIPPA